MKLKKILDSKDLKSLKPFIILLIIFLSITFALINIKYSNVKALKQLNKEAFLATNISILLHETQKERGLTAGYIASKGEKFKKELIMQRKRTDRQKRLLIGIYKQYENNLLKDKLKQAIEKLNTLKKIRGLVDSFVILTNTAIAYYSEINELFLELIQDISKNSKFPKITQNLVAYSNFLYAKEYAGIERALGTQILSNKYFLQSRINDFNSLIVKQDVFLKLYYNYASNDFKIKQKIYPNVEQIQRVIISSDKDRIYEIDVKKWFNSISKKIDDYKIIDDKLSNKLISYINEQLSTSYRDLIIILTLNIISIIIFISIIGFILILIKSEHKLRDLIDKNVIISTADTSGVITDASQAFCDISGYEKNELVGKPHNIIRHPDTPKSKFKDLWTTIQQGKTWRGEIKNRRKDGSSYWVQAIISPIYNKNKITGYSAIRHDITDKKKVEKLNQTLEEKIKFEVDKHREKDKQLIQQSRLAQLGEMISMIAHQWRQPLSAISSTASAINLKANFDSLDKDTAAELSKNIIDYSNHLSTTIDDFRDFYKSEKQTTLTDYTKLVESVLKIVETSISTKNIKLIKELNCKKKFHTYHNEVKQVILNLIKNAEDILLEKHIKEPYIKISSYIEDNEYVLEVKDNGGGVPEEIKEHIFDPYFSTKMQKDGTGLGLYMSKIIIEDHCKGKLNILNKNGCAVFQIRLNDSLKEQE